MAVPSVLDSSVEAGRLTDLRQDIPGHVIEPAVGAGSLGGMSDSMTDPCVAETLPRSVHCLKKGAVLTDRGISGGWLFGG